MLSTMLNKRSFIAIDVCKRCVYLDVVPLVIVHGVDVDAQLGSRETHAGHLVLETFDFESSRYNVMQQKLRSEEVRSVNRVYELSRWNNGRSELTPLRSLGLSLNFCSAFSGPPSCTSRVRNALSVGTNIVYGPAYDNDTVRGLVAL